MNAFRFPNSGLFLLSASLAFSLYLFVVDGAAAGQAKDLHQVCRQARDDDTIHPYSHDLYDETAVAFRKLFPDAKGALSDSDFETQAQFRCMAGKVMVCFIGANLPCVKMSASRDNPGANEYCKGNPNEDFVPLAATGHDAVYSYRCRNGKAEIAGDAWKLDKRGFAKKLWTALPDR